MSTDTLEAALRELSVKDVNASKHKSQAAAAPLTLHSNPPSRLKAALQPLPKPKQRAVAACRSIRVVPSAEEDEAERQSVKLVKQPAAQKLHLGMFEIGKPLGKGKFGRVYLARDRAHGFICALKVMYKNEISHHRYERQVQREIEIQTNLRHPNIVKLYGHFHDSKRIFLILEFAGKGELYKHLRREGRFAEDKAAQYIAQMAGALRYLHRKHVMHRDIKPENILVGVFGELKISDFGWSVHAPSNRRATRCGTLDYLPPEMVQPTSADRSYDERIDVWALGVLLYEFLVGEAPFEDTEVMTYRRIARGDVRVPSYVSAEARDLIHKVRERESVPMLPCNG
ncbi:serine/threonine-protein kinase [Stachybotrys elegans]|uniref:Aurora kinase n=1 Tax=Stachybotrys elegans TaxID=80388 RepID=A0A8K0SP13_9HYPO|nr:serine/threonine-protein kinase [Stachybotrys elegans]